MPDLFAEKKSAEKDVNFAVNERNRTKIDLGNARKGVKISKKNGEDASTRTNEEEVIRLEGELEKFNRAIIPLYYKLDYIKLAILRLEQEEREKDAKYLQKRSSRLMSWFSKRRRFGLDIAVLPGVIEEKERGILNVKLNENIRENIENASNAKKGKLTKEEATNIKMKTLKNANLEGMLSEIRAETQKYMDMTKSPTNRTNPNKLEKEAKKLIREATKYKPNDKTLKKAEELQKNNSDEDGAR